MKKTDNLRAMDYLGHIVEAIDRIHRYVGSSDFKMNNPGGQLDNIDLADLCGGLEDTRTFSRSRHQPS